MDGDHIRFIEHRSQAMHRDIRMHRVELGKISNAIQEGEHKVANSAGTFKRLKEALFVESSAQNRSPLEVLARTRIVAESAGRAGVEMKKAQGAVAALGVAHQKIQQVLGKSQLKLDKLTEQLDSLKKKIASVVDAREFEELTEIHTRDRKDALDALRSHEASSPRDSESLNRMPDPIATVDPGRALGDAMPPIVQRDGGKANANQGEADSSSNPVPSRFTFRDAVTAAGTLQVDAMSQWDRLEEKGVQLRVNAGQQRELEVAISSHGAEGVKVVIESANVRDMQSLWRGRREIVEALESRGCKVIEVVVRRRSDQCNL